MSPETTSREAQGEPHAVQPDSHRSPAPTRRATEDQKLELVQKYQAFIFELDGTLWRGGTLLPGVIEVLDLLRYQGKKIFFVTNNASLSRHALLKRFQALGLKASFEEIFSSAYATAAYLKGKKFNQKVYVIGEAGLMEEMEAMGIEALGGPSHRHREVDLEADEPGALSVDPKVGAVVVGLDRTLNYYKIQYGLKCLLENSGCMFLATNTDSRAPFGTKQDWAGAGAMVGALIGASEAEPVVLGKPSAFLLDAVCRASGLARPEMCVVGDRLVTDVLWGQRNGCGAVLVLSGATSEADLGHPDNTIFPDMYMDSVGDLLSIKDKLSACVIS